MNVICPSCSTTIPSSHTNESRGIAYCQQCRDYYVMEDYLMRDQGLVRRENDFINTSKSPDNKIQIKEGLSQTKIIIPASKIPIITRIFLLFAIGLIFYALHNLFKLDQVHDVEFYAKAGFLLAVNLLFIFLLFLNGHKTILTLSKNTIQVSRKRYLFPNYISTRKTKNLGDIDTYYISGDHDNDSGSETGVSLAFKNEKEIKVAFNLKTEHQNWLAGQLIGIRDKLLLDEKVRVDIDSKFSQARLKPFIKNTTNPDYPNTANNTYSPSEELKIPQHFDSLQAYGTLFMFLFVGLFFGFFAYGYLGGLPSFEPQTTAAYLSAAFSLVGFVSFLNHARKFIYQAKQKLTINSSEIKLELKPFGFYILKSRNTHEFTEVIVDKNWQFLALKFKNDKDLRVGYSFDKEEKKYFIGRITSMIEEAKK